MPAADSIIAVQDLLAAVPRNATSAQLIIGLLLMGGLGFLLCFGALLLGRFIRPRRPNPEKNAIYECGEPTIGSGWIQFDLRFYVVALVFIVFDVEIALFWPWAVVFGGGGLDPEAPASPRASLLESVRSVAVYDMLFFFGVIVVGFLYLWRFGYLDWVRAIKPQGRTASTAVPAAVAAGAQNP
jgi:NADH-quinone oxidoreductase subunit A